MISLCLSGLQIATKYYSFQHENVMPISKQDLESENLIPFMACELINNVKIKTLKGSGRVIT